MQNFQVVEAALHSRIQRLEQRLMDLEPGVSIEKLYVQSEIALCDIQEKMG